MKNAEIESRVKDLLSKMTLEEKAVQLASYFPNGNIRLGIPQIIAGEALHGVVLPEASCFPQAIGLAATWDPKLIEDMGVVIGKEGRALGMHQCYSPMLGLARDPRWGRVEESYGEDPWLVARLGVAFISSVQGLGDERYGPDKMICTPKHFVADGESLRGANAEQVEISETTLRETAMIPFEAAVREARTGSIMPAHHALNRIPCHANKWLLKDVLRDEWGFDGFITSDNGDIIKNFHWDVESGHYMARSTEEAGHLALKAGIDSELALSNPWDGNQRAYGAQLVKAVEVGRIPVALVDQAAANVLRAKLELGLLGDPIPEKFDVSRAIERMKENRTDFDPWAEAIRKGISLGLEPEKRANWKEVVMNPDHEKLALKIAEKSIVLLRNEGGLLPLDKSKLKKVAVLGPNAAAEIPGGYSNKPRYFVSVLEGIQNFLGDTVEVVHAKGCGLVHSKDDDIPAAVELAKGADVAIIAVGTSRETMGENLDRSIIELTGAQEELVRAVHATGTPVVVVLINGGALAIPWLAANVPAIVEGWYGGQETGNAVANVLFGRTNPGGKLPLTFPYSTGMVPCYYNALPPAGPQTYLEGKFRVVYPFGYGLSYTTFEFGKPTLAHDKIGADGKTELRVKVTNTGSRKGDEVVQMYVKRRFASTVRPPRELKGFERITLEPGESRDVVIPVGFEQLKSWLGGKWTVESGEFVLQVGPDSVTGQDVTLAVE